MTPRRLVDAIPIRLNLNHWVRAWLLVVGLFMFGLANTCLHKNTRESILLALFSAATSRASFFA
jgi:hypothetical protein